MCMRPCGPVRHSWGPRRTITKKETYEILSSAEALVELETADGFCPYDGPVSKLRSELRSGATSIQLIETKSSVYYKEGYRTIVMRGSYIASVIVIREKR